MDEIKHEIRHEIKHEIKNHIAESELVEVLCNTCKKRIYVQKGYIREKMYCTIKCLRNFGRNPLGDSFFESFGWNDCDIKCDI